MNWIKKGFILASIQAFTLVSVGFFFATTARDYVLVKNNVDASAFVKIDPGLTATQIGDLQLLDRGTLKWSVGRDASNNFRVLDSVLGYARIGADSGSTYLRSPTVIAFQNGAGTQFASLSISSGNFITTGVVNGSSGLQVSAGSTITDSSIIPKAVRSCGATTTCSNSAWNDSRFIIGTVTLSGGTAVVTGISPAFVSSTSYVCIATDRTANVSVKCANTSASSVTFTGTSTDVIQYMILGN